MVQYVSEIMTSNPRSMHRNTLVCVAAGILTSNSISAAPIVDDRGKITGMITKSDITRFDSTGDDPNYAKVHEIASPNLIRIDSSASVSAAAQKMLANQIHHLLVQENEMVIGILSSFDFVKLTANDLNNSHCSNLES